MPKRRNVLIGLGGMVALAGCSDEDPEFEEGDVPEDDDEEPEEEETEADEESETQDDDGSEEVEEEAVFEITGILDGESYSGEDEVPIGGEIENTGNETGTQNVELVNESGTFDEDVELEPGEETNFAIAWGTADEFDPGTYEYTLRTEDDEVTASVNIEEPEPSAEDIEIVEHEMVIDEGDFMDDIYVEGIVSNNADTMASYVQVTVRIYDGDGNQLDSYIDNTSDLGADTTWAFEVMILEDAEDIDDYDIAVEDIRF